MDWFHLAKVYSSTAGCIGFWCIRHVKKLSSNRIALCFPPLILAINICEAVLRDFEIGRYVTPVMEYTNNQTQYYIGGAWNYMNGIAGILNIITITGWFGICIRAVTKKDGSRDMLWPDMMWFWIVAYDLWNFAYTYNCLPTHAWYCGFALLLAPTVCAFTVGKGAWLQRRAHTLALWCMFAQTVPAFQDASRWMVHSTSSKAIADAANPAGICGCGWVYCTGGTRYLSACLRKSGHHGAFCGKPACASCKRGGIYLYDPSYKKDKTQSLQDRAVFRLGVLSENKDTGKIGRMNAVLYLEATE